MTARPNTPTAPEWAWFGRTRQSGPDQRWHILKQLSIGGDGEVITFCGTDCIVSVRRALPKNSSVCPQCLWLTEAIHD